MSSFEVFTAAFKKFQIFWDKTSVYCCAVTDISKELATSIIRVVQKECHTPEDLNHYRYSHKKNIALQYPEQINVQLMLEFDFVRIT
jgi:hypothetical protein